MPSNKQKLYISEHICCANYHLVTLRENWEVRLRQSLLRCFPQLWRVAVVCTELLYN